MNDDARQPAPDEDDVQALLLQEYAAPPLDDRFNNDLVVKLAATVAPPSPRRDPRAVATAVGLCMVAAAGLAIVALWVGSRPTRDAEAGLAHNAPAIESPQPHQQPAREPAQPQREETLRIAETEPAEPPRLERLAQEQQAPSMEGRQDAPEQEQLATTPLVLVEAESIVPTVRELSVMGRRSLPTATAEAEVIVVATAVGFSRANEDTTEYVITFAIKRTLKGEFDKKILTTQTPTKPHEFIDKQWIVMLSPAYLAGTTRYAGIYHDKLEPKVVAILAPNQVP